MTQTPLRHRIASMFMSMTLFFFSIPVEPFQAIAEGEESENHALDILLNATDLQTRTGTELGLSDTSELSATDSGKTVHFEVESALSDANARDDVTVTITVKATDCIIHFNQFRDGILNFNSSSDSKGVTLHLTQNEESGDYEITYTLTQGQSVNGFLEYTIDEGTTQNGSKVEISIDSDYDGTGNENIVINDIVQDSLTVYNHAAPEWEDISKSADTTEVGIENGHLNQDIVYTLEANPPSKIDGIIYAGSYTVEDTFTLPDDFSLIEGSGSIEYDGKTAIYQIDGTPVLKFDSAYPITEGSIIMDGLSFTYTEVNQNVNYQMIL